MFMTTSYAYKAPEPGKSAHAILYGSNISYKDACQVCSAVRGRNTERAIEFLQLAAVGEKAIWFRSHNSGKGHRRELGGKKGGWPVKCAKVILGVVQSALGNANKKGLAPTKIAHISANKQDTLPRMSPKGKRIRMDYETAVIQVVLQEMKIPEHHKALAAKKAAEQKKTDAKKAEIKTAANEQKKTDAKTDAKKAETKAQTAEQKAQAEKSSAQKAEEKKEEQAAQKIAQNAENAAQRTAAHSSTHEGNKPSL
jgi:large subunit ribosomal protein L22